MTKPTRVQSPADLLAYIPHALGFTPVESFVFLTLQGTMLGATLRVDGPQGGDPTDWAQMVVHYLLADTEADGAVMVAYTNEQAGNGGTPYREHADAVTVELERAEIILRNSWIITNKGWSNYNDEGPMMPLEDITGSAMAAEMVYRGSNPAAKATIAEPDYTGGITTGQINAACWQFHTTDATDMDTAPMRQARALWAENIGTVPEEETAAALIASLQVKATRDRVLADFINTNDETYRETLIGQSTTRPDWHHVDAAETLLIGLLAQTPTADRAPLFTVLGWIQWHKGSGRAAGNYMAKALATDPGYKLALLLDELFNHGILPAVAMNGTTAYRT